MSQPDDEFAGKVVRMLDRGVENLAARTSERLAAARSLAMSRYQPEPRRVRGLAWVLSTVPHGDGHGQYGVRYAVATGALLLALIGIGYWQTMAPGNGDPADIDADLLAGELPINAYLDKGFDSWLKRASR